MLHNGEPALVAVFPHTRGAMVCVLALDVVPRQQLV